MTGIQMKADGVDHPFRAPMTGPLVVVVAEAAAAAQHADPVVQQPLRRRARGPGGGPAAGQGRAASASCARARRSHCAPISTARAARATGSQEPLRVKEGDYVGLTAVTWMPAFAVNLDAAANYWLASRPKDRCARRPASRPKRFAAYYRATQAHLQSSTVKVYQCTYQTARLLYWARIVPDGAPAGPRPAGA